MNKDELARLSLGELLDLTDEELFDRLHMELEEDYERIDQPILDGGRRRVEVVLVPNLRGQARPLEK